jgi:L,D-transpeptidase YcbB
MSWGILAIAPGLLAYSQQIGMAHYKGITMKRKMLVIMVLVWTWDPTLAGSQSPSILPLSDRVREGIRNRIEAAGIPPVMPVGDEFIYASVELIRFYERRTYRWAWSNEKGPLHQAGTLMNAVRKAYHEGLQPNHYHLGRLEAILENVGESRASVRPFNPDSLVDLDLLLTDTFLIYASQLLSGRVNPETIDPEWHANRREVDLAERLETALAANQIQDTLKSFLPPQPGYTKLREELASYRDIAEKGGWPMVPDGPRIQKGDSGPRIAALRARLMASGDIDPGHQANGDLFDDEVEQAVYKFQRRHGLDVDGIVGAATVAALDVPVEERMGQIELNMERWRWLPQDLGRRYILVNIASFELDVVEEGKPIMTMRAIVGRPYRRTPVFSSKMIYLVLSPYWYIPTGIATEDILPILHKDPEYLTRQNIKIFQGWGADAKEIEPKSIDWSIVTAKNFKYRFRQEPGPWNALGRIKFMFPNKFNVYLHDTPSRELFTKTVRGFSSGCIRIERPIELAKYVLGSDSRWTQDKILASIDKGVEQTVRLPEPIPLHLLYWTAWVEDDGLIHFRNDIYGRDKRLSEALRKEPPKGLGSQTVS